MDKLNPMAMGLPNGDLPCSRSALKGHRVVPYRLTWTCGPQVVGVEPHSYTSSKLWVTELGCRSATQWRKLSQSHNYPFLMSIVLLSNAWDLRCGVFVDEMLRVQLCWSSPESSCWTCQVLSASAPGSYKRANSCCICTTTLSTICICNISIICPILDDF